MNLLVENGLKEIEDKLKKTQDRGFEPMKGLHIDSQTRGHKKALIGINFMKENFSKFFDNLTNVSSSNQNRVVEIQKLNGCIHMAMEEPPNQLNSVKELAREYSKWLLRYTKIHMPNHKDLIPIIVATKTNRKKVKKKGKKILLL